MILRRTKLVPGGLLLALLLLAACSPIGNGGTGTGSTQDQGSASPATSAATITPRLVTPRSSSGSPGQGTLVITSPTPVPGGKAGAQQIVLGDRTLIINGVSEQKGASTGSTSITLDLAVHNTSAQPIMNQSAFFRLLGPEDDIFGSQSNGSDPFFGTIAAHMTRSGTIVFQVPVAATSGLRLLYRPEVATETAIISLKLA